MNILLINKFYFEKGGAERYFFDLKKLLESKNHKVIPFAMQHAKNLKTKYSKYFISEIKTKPLLNIWQNLRTIFRFWWSWEARRKIKKILKENKIDIVHLNNIYHQISPSILPIFKKYNIPVIMTVHDYALISPNYNLFLDNKIYDKICGKQYYKCLFDKCVNNSSVQSLISVIEMYLHHKILKVYKKNINTFISPSKFVADKLILAGFNKNKIKILPHFVSAEKQKNRKTLEQEKYILYFGRLSKEKGVKILIKAMKQLPNIKLKIVGDGPEKKNYELRIKNYGLNNIEILNHQDKNNLYSLILNSEFVVVPSLAPETFGLSALEAMTFGKTVLVSKIGALPELINEKYLFEPGNVNDLINKINSLTKDKKNVKVNEYANLEKVSKYYNSDRYYTELEQIYKLKK